MPQAFDFSGIAPAAPEPPPPRPAMTFATVNGQRVPVDDADPMAPGVVTVIGRPGIVPPAPPVAPPPPPPATSGGYNFADIPAAKPPDPSLWERLNTSPFHDQFEAARNKSWQDITAPTADQAQDPISAAVRGMRAGTAEGVLSFLEQSFTTPIGAALWLTGLGPESAAVKAVPALKPLVSAPAINALRVAVHGTAGAAFAAHGAGTMGAGAATIYKAATSQEAPPEGRGAQALSGLGEMGQGAIEAAGGVLGMHGAYTAAKPTIDAWQQTRRTAAGAAALDDFRKAAPPAVSSPYTTDQLQRGYSLILRDHVTTQPITSIAEGITAADNQIARFERGFDQLIAVDPNQLITTKPLDAVHAQLGQSRSGGPPVSNTDLARGLADLKQYGLDQPLTVQRANDIRIRLNAENAGTLIKTGYDIAKAREIEPAFAAREAAVASLREGIHDVLDPRAQQTPGFTRDLRLDEGAVIALRQAMLRQQYRNEATVGGTGRTGLTRKIIAGGIRATGVGAGTAGGAAVGGVPGAIGGGIIGGVIAEPIVAAIDQPPLTRDALIARSFERAAKVGGTSLQTTPPGGAATAPGAGIVVPGTGPGGGGPGAPPSGGPGAPPGGGAGSSTRATAVDTFLALRARGYSREQAVQMAASYARSLPPASGPAFTEGEIVPDATGPTGAPPAAPGPRELPSPGVPRQLGPATYAARIAELETPPASATIAADAAPAVADQPAAAARAGDVARDRGPQLPDAASERVLPAAERPDRGGSGKAARAADRATARAEALAEEQQGLADLVTQAQANGYTGDPAALHAELADRLQGIKELHAELDAQGTNGLTLLRAIAQYGGLSEKAATYDGAGGELRMLKELRDTAPTTRKNAGNLAARRVLDTVRGVRGVFREETARGGRGGFVGGQSLESMLEQLQQDPRFSYITTANELSEAIRTAAVGREESRNALKDLSATSHDLIGTATIHPEDDLSFDPAALEVESQAHAAAQGASVVDTLDTGEQQPRLPEAGAARQVGHAPIAFRAPVQASGGDFALEAPRAAVAPQTAAATLLDRMHGPEAPREVLPKGVIYLNGDRAAYTTKTETVGGKVFYEVRLLEGPRKGTLAVTPRAPAEKE